ncbi:MAG: hypothetical protein NTV49_13415 [Kiritimatiellaeota bacterium]|nr:hypothetical protein [Kiritimatiellota bacterium]
MTPGTLLKPMSLLTAMTMLVLAPGALAQKPVEAPSNAPATVAWDAATGKITLRYHDKVILDAVVRVEDAAGRVVAGTAFKLEPAEARDEKEKVGQRLKFTLAGPKQGVKLVLRGTVSGSAEAFPAETESAAQQRFPLVRNSAGPSRSLRNNAVYDRRWDWVLSGPADGATRIQPKPADKERTTFTWESQGASLELVFRPRFYQKHKGLGWFEPWTYPMWKSSVTGFCSWWAYRDGFNQQALDEIAEVFAAQHLPDFGYRYLQVDACYESGGGPPQGFLNWNGKFPGGAEYFVRKTRSAGMEPGVWVFCLFYEKDPVVREAVKQHPAWFVREPDGKARRFPNPWTGAWWYALDPTNEEALDAMVRPTYRGLSKLGFTYVKIDGAGDLGDWGYRKSTGYLKGRETTPGEALRRFYQAARNELGRDVYILTCWGVLPEQIGVADGCRLATDGFRAASFQGFNSWEGVVWRNDPDHCDILPGGKAGPGAMKTFAVDGAPPETIIRPCVISMAGGVLLLSDKAGVYKDARNLEGVKRSSPVLFTVPGQLYDYTPRGPAWSFEKSFRDYCQQWGGEATWWLQEIDRPFEHWSVLARFQWGEGTDRDRREMRGAPAREIEFADLGLEADRADLVFEFWTQTFLGKSKGSFTAPAQGPDNGLQVFAIREAREHPWVLSTTRHISQGGVDLLDERWDAGSQTLSGQSAVVVGDPYVLTVHLPAGFQLKTAAVGGEKAELAQQAETATMRFVPSATKAVEWKMTFAR